MLPARYNASSMLRSHYGVLERIGQYHSHVFRGRGNDGRYVAVRFCRLDSDWEIAELLETAAVASQLSHPMLAAVGGCQSYQDGALCIVSEYVPGVTLQQWVGEHGLPALRVTIDFMRRLCLGVHAMHQRGLAHCALHPGNLMVLQPDTQPDGRIVAKLLDIGVPASVRPWPPRPEVVPYLAPELLDRAGEVEDVPIIDARANVYSCGALLHYLCTGVAPLRAADGSRRATAADLGALLSDAPESLEPIIAHALAIDPRDRPSSAAELANALGYVESEWSNSGVRRALRIDRDTDPDALTPAVRIEPEKLPEAHRSTPPTPVAAFAAPERPSVAPRVQPPPTGSFPRVEFAMATPAARRWLGGLGGLAVACVLTLYVASIPSETRQSTAPAATDEQAPRVAHGPAPHAASAPIPPPMPNPSVTGFDEPEPAPTPAPVLATESRTRRDASKTRAAVEQPVLAEANEPEISIVSDPEPATSEDALAVPSDPSAAEPLEATGTVYVPSEPPAVAPVPTPSVASETPISEPPPERAAAEPASGEGSQPIGEASARAPVEVRVASINVRGGLSVSTIRRAIERIRPLFTHCYQRHVSVGQVLPVLVTAVIDEVGRVRSRPSVEGANHPALSECLATAASKMVSDRPDTGTVKASWKLSL
jgi:serine/threonine protein kinase